MTCLRTAWFSVFRIEITPIGRCMKALLRFAATSVRTDHGASKLASTLATKVELEKPNAGDDELARYKDSKQNGQVLCKIMSLADYASHYWSLGECTQHRADKDPKVVHIKKVIKLRKECGFPLAGSLPELFSPDAARWVADLHERVNVDIEAHGRIYVAAGCAALKAARDALLPVAGGDSGGKRWCQHLKDDCSFQALLDAGAATFCKQQKDFLIPVIRAFATETTRDKLRHELFGLQRDEASVKSNSDLIFTGRVTLTERLLFEAVTHQSTNPGSAKDQVNSQIKAWPTVKIQATDLHPKLWQVCICSGNLIKT